MPIVPHPLSLRSFPPRSRLYRFLPLSTHTIPPLPHSKTHPYLLLLLSPSLARTRSKHTVSKTPPKRSDLSTTTIGSLTDPNPLTTALDAALARLRSTLSSVRPGGRFDSQVLEKLEVKLKTSESAAGAREKDAGKKGKGKEKDGAAVRLMDLASLVPRGGRGVGVLVGEKEHLKPILSTLLSSPYSLNPTPSATNPLELHVAIPPPTATSRLQAVEGVKRAGEKAEFAIREARAAHKKRLDKMKAEMGPDRWFKASQEMEKVVKGRKEEVERVVGEKRGSVERG